MSDSDSEPTYEAMQRELEKIYDTNQLLSMKLVISARVLELRDGHPSPELTRTSKRILDLIDKRIDQVEKRRVDTARVEFVAIVLLSCVFVWFVFKMWM